MSFTVSFYTCTANPKKLDKTGDLAIIGSAKTLHAKHKMDMLNPVFEVDYNAAFLPANYCYIAEFGRYYFCTIATDTAQKITVSCTVDPLYSFAADIKKCNVTIIRAQLGRPTYTIDKKYPIDSTRYVIEGIDFDASDVLTGSLPQRPYIIVTR